MTNEQARILRECAVDLIRASDLRPELAEQRIAQVQHDLASIAAEMRIARENFRLLDAA